jgi:hypothetical protein
MTDINIVAGNEIRLPVQATPGTNPPDGQISIYGKNDTTAGGGGGGLLEPKALVTFTPTTTINKQSGVSSITNIGTGRQRVNFSTAFADTNYVVAGSADNTSSLGALFAVEAKTTSNCTVQTWDTGSSVDLFNADQVHVVFWGDQ